MTITTKLQSQQQQHKKKVFLMPPEAWDDNKCVSCEFLMNK